MCRSRATLLKYGSCATAAGVTLLVELLNAPVPAPFAAATRKTYAVPFVRPVTVALVAVDAARVNV
jgi:hypothetical protein